MRCAERKGHSLEPGGRVGQGASAGVERRWFEAGRGRRSRSEEVEGGVASEPGGRAAPAGRTISAPDALSRGLTSPPKQPPPRDHCPSPKPREPHGLLGAPALSTAAGRPGGRPRPDRARWAAALDGGTGQLPGTYRPEGQSQLGVGGVRGAGGGVRGAGRLAGNRASRQRETQAGPWGADRGARQAGPEVPPDPVPEGAAPLIGSHARNRGREEARVRARAGDGAGPCVRATCAVTRPWGFPRLRTGAAAPIDGWRRLRADGGGGGGRGRGVEQPPRDRTEPRRVPAAAPAERPERDHLPERRPRRPRRRGAGAAGRTSAEVSPEASPLPGFAAPVVLALPRGGTPGTSPPAPPQSPAPPPPLRGRVFLPRPGGVCGAGAGGGPAGVGRGRGGGPRLGVSGPGPGFGVQVWVAGSAARVLGFWAFRSGSGVSVLGWGLGFLSASGVLVGVRGPGLQVQGPKPRVRVRALASPGLCAGPGSAARPPPRARPPAPLREQRRRVRCCSGCGCPSFAREDVVFQRRALADPRLLRWAWGSRGATPGDPGEGPAEGRASSRGPGVLLGDRGVVASSAQGLFVDAVPSREDGERRDVRCVVGRELGTDQPQPVLSVRAVRGGSGPAGRLLPSHGAAGFLEAEGTFVPASDAVSPSSGQRRLCGPDDVGGQVGVPRGDPEAAAR
ncbi:collagen alpha-1(I) chain-like [Phyllostomus discolor]|uniref:Collagen alpha-1(I) chain-like n=1 Tax=Phyllostomus discolor TaxID=89673 RepID=A0A7E6DPS6_9CHIR|nr:collagen alpha-1(I) chain-like [Phyllostomus discolor]